MPFVKGQSGNPGGRRSKLPPEVRDLARRHTAASVAVLAANLKSKVPAVRNQAAAVLLDRGWGKPVTPIEANVSILDRLNESEQQALLAALSAFDRDESDAGLN
ncbi:MAG: hypothetical protein U1E81_08165 [Xanthobacteraceae bacterium]